MSGVGEGAAGRRGRRLFLGGALVFAVMVLPACADFVEVRNPMELESGEVDPVEDAEMFSRSAFQTFVEAFGNVSVHGAWFTNEAWVGDSFPTRNEFGLRRVTETNSEHEVENWRALHRALSQAQAVIRALEEVPGIPLARGYLTAGWSILLMAETFCQGTIPRDERTPGPPLSTSELAAEAVLRLEEAEALAREQGDGAEAEEMAWAARVGRARAHLLAGEENEARALALEVPEDFRFELPHTDDPDQRRRLGNRMWEFSDQRPSLVTPPHVRDHADSGDPRVPYRDMERSAQDGELRFFRQEKFPGWGAPSLLTSGLEARYVAVEAGGDAGEMRAWVNERRALGGEDPLGEALDGGSLLHAFFVQKGLDHWLEGKRMGDLRRHGDDLPWMWPPGDGFYKPILGVVGGQTCWPVPAAERWNNPYWD